MKRPLFRSTLALSFLLLAATACSGNTEPIIDATPPPAPGQNAAELENPTELEPAEPEPAPFQYPLTGMPAHEELTERPFVVMVENSPAARPQSGLDAADIVYEVLAEGDITRFIAVYHSEQSAEIGPVRSIRPYFVELGAGLDGVLVHAGWSQEAMNLIAKGRLNHMDQVYGDHAYYWRDSSRKAPHNVYTSTEKMKEGAVAKKFRTEWKAPVLKFVGEAGSEGSTATKGQTANSVHIPYLQGYTVGYTYDDQTKLYMRLLKDAPHKDKKTDAQLSATNVLIVEATHKIVDNVGRRHVNVKGPGKGYLLQNGLIREIRWENTGGAIRPFAVDENGKKGDELPLQSGKTWVQIVPAISKVTYE